MQWILRSRQQGRCDPRPLVLIVLLAVSFGLSACSDLQDNPTAPVTGPGCARCHTDQEQLMRLATEEPSDVEDAGEG